MKGKGLILLALVLLTLPTVAAMLTTTTVVAAASTTYWKVNINLVGNGTLRVMLFDPTTQKIANQSVITHSTSFLVPNATYIVLESNQSFVVNNQGMITKTYGQPITSNTTLTVNFDVQNVKLQLIEVKIVLLNNGSLTVIVANLRNLTLYGNMTINQTTTLGVPPNSTVFLSSKVPFRVVNISVPRYFTTFAFNATKPTIVAILFASPSTTSSSTSTSTTTSSSTSSSTLPPPPSSTTSSNSTQYSTVLTLPAHTEALTLITSSTPSSSSTTIYYIIIAVLIVAVIAYLMLRRRK